MNNFNQARKVLNFLEHCKFSEKQSVNLTAVMYRRRKDIYQLVNDFLANILDLIRIVYNLVQSFLKA